MMRPADLPVSNHYHGHASSQLIAEYAYLWPGTTISKDWTHEADIMTLRAGALMEMYKRVQARRNVPWAALAALDMRESGCDPMGCLANGDPYNKMTIHYPSGKGPWASKESSFDWALDDFESPQGYGVNLHRIKWDISQVLLFCEKWNGFLPRIEHGTVPADASPYIYSGSVFEGKPLYERGKRKERLGEDSRMHGYWDPSQIDRQLGCLAFLKALEAKGYNILG